MFNAQAGDIPNVGKFSTKRCVDLRHSSTKHGICRRVLAKSVVGLLHQSSKRGTS